jgi:hypothetical protein
LVHVEAYPALATSGGLPFVIDLTGSNSLGAGFYSALFQILGTGNLVVNQSFANLAAAQASSPTSFSAFIWRQA